MQDSYFQPQSADLFTKSTYELVGIQQAYVESHFHELNVLERYGVFLQTAALDFELGLITNEPNGIIIDIIETSPVAMPGLEFVFYKSFPGIQRELEHFSLTAKYEASWRETALNTPNHMNKAVALARLVATFPNETNITLLKDHLTYVIERFPDIDEIHELDSRTNTSSKLQGTVGTAAWLGGDEQHDDYVFAPEDFFSLSNVVEILRDTKLDIAVDQLDEYIYTNLEYLDFENVQPYVRYAFFNILRDTYAISLDEKVAYANCFEEELTDDTEIRVKDDVFNLQLNLAAQANDFEAAKRYFNAINYGATAQYALKTLISLAVRTGNLNQLRRLLPEKKDEIFSKIHNLDTKPNQYTSDELIANRASFEHQIAEQWLLAAEDLSQNYNILIFTIPELQAILNGSTPDSMIEALSKYGLNANKQYRKAIRDSLKMRVAETARYAEPTRGFNSYYCKLLEKIIRYKHLSYQR